MIARVNALRLRLSFRLWSGFLALQLRRRGARLVVDAPHLVRMDGWPHIDVRPEVTSLTLRFGRGVSLGRSTHLDLLAGDNVLEMGDFSYLLHGVRLQLRDGTIRMAEGVNVRDGVVLKSEGLLELGHAVPVSYGGMIHCKERIIIGDNAGLAERVTVVDSDHTHDGSDTPFLEAPLRVSPVHIGDNVFVCANAVVMRGADIGANSVVGANAVVGAGEHPGGHLYAGAPARPVRPL